MLLTKRLILRNWQQTDCKSLYFLASNFKIANACGFKKHCDEKESLLVIKNIFSKPFHYAVCLKEKGDLIGSVSFKSAQDSVLTKNQNEAEVGYWIGENFWRAGYCYEALEKLIEFGFNNLKLKKIWASVAYENFKSFNLLKKLGFLMYETKNIYFKAIEKEKFSKVLFLKA